MHTGMKLALCATLKDELVGEDYIADYLLYWLNINHNFSYVSLMDLTEPEDDGAVMLAKERFKIINRLSESGSPSPYIPLFIPLMKACKPVSFEHNLSDAYGKIS